MEVILTCNVHTSAPGCNTNTLTLHGLSTARGCGRFHSSAAHAASAHAAFARIKCSRRFCHVVSCCPGCRGNAGLLCELQESGSQAAVLCWILVVGGQAGLRRPGMGGGDAQEAAFAGGPSVRGISRRRGRRQWHLPQQVCPSSLLFFVHTTLPLR